MVLLLWCVCGGLLAHMLEANFLTILLKPVYEKPINTAQDILDRGFAIIFPPYSEDTKKILMNSPYYTTRALAESAIVPKVIFCYTESFLFNLYFLGRIGLNLMLG